jgi:electron transfer flavoprotein-quinone oxidoreductase
MKAHPSIAPLVEGGSLKEYSAHVIPEGGFKAMPTLTMPGMIIAGDAAATCLAAGIWLEGVNFAIGSGMAAARTALGSSADLDAAYRRELGWVLDDHRKLRELPDFMLSDRVQRDMPGLTCNIVERIFRVDNPMPKPGVLRIVRDEMKRSGLRYRDVTRDAWTAWRSLS